MEDDFLWSLLDSRIGIGRCHTQEVAYTPNIVTLAVCKFAAGFAWLRLQFAPLLAYPSQLGKGVGADILKAVSAGAGNNDATIGRIDAEMDIPNVFSEDLHGQIAEVNHVRHQYSGCCLIMGKRRSTSAGSCRISKIARLTAFSLAKTPRHEAGAFLRMAASNSFAKARTGSPFTL